jgi:hypothetical protein
MCERPEKGLSGGGNGTCTYQAGMRRKAVWATFIGVLALIVALMWVGPDQRGSHGTGVSAVGYPPVGTAGRESADEPDESPATLHDLETVTGTVDPHELIGRRVDFHVKVADLNNYTSFWVANKDNRMLVVHAAPSPNDITQAAPGQMVRITGTIEGIPLKDQLDQTVYIRAEHVIPEG